MRFMAYPYLPRWLHLCKYIMCLIELALVANDTRCYSSYCRICLLENTCLEIHHALVSLLIKTLAQCQAGSRSSPGHLAIMICSTTDSCRDTHFCICLFEICKSCIQTPCNQRLSWPRVYEIHQLACKIITKVSSDTAHLQDGIQLD